MSIVSVIRLVGGLAMVAGGVVLCTPLTMEAVSALGRRPMDTIPAPPASPDMVADPGTGVVAVEPGPTVPVVEPVFPLADADLPPESGLPVRAAYVPPVAPPTLAGPAPAAAAPEVEAAYRSMIDIPPPALLDAQRPPPSPVSWSAAARPPLPTRSLPDALVPATCVVRDGDDLEGIATRYYGHPSAASAIWGANRERLPDPRVLPIGMELRLPPPWTVMPAGTETAPGGAPAIEPPAGDTAGATPARGVPVPTAVPADVAVNWLAQPAGAPQAALPPHAALPPQAVAPPVARPAAVRVAAGETLASIATRFYGDERMAEQIWLANRDRLRSPALVVPGMELRLP
jgi:nucleoid-associated protein YgaU